MDTSNASASQESEIQPDSAEKDCPNESSHLGSECDDGSNSTLNLRDNTSKIDAPEANTGSSETATMDETQSGCDSSDLADADRKSEEQCNETPVCCGYSEEASFVKDEESQDTLPKQCGEEENIATAEASWENTDDNTTNIINNSSSPKTVACDNQNTDEQSSNDHDPINDQGDEQKYSGDRNNSPYYIKWIMWSGMKTPVVTQNDNGPCPLLAIINILLLRRTITFPNMQEMVTTRQLMEYLGDVVLKEIPENMPEGAQRNYEQNVQDTLSILPKLQTGLDVNVKFTGVGDFEFTRECGIFDLLSIKLYHGWLVDPQSTEYKAAIGNLSYNQLVEMIVTSKEADGKSEISSDGILAQSFLEETANQLTCHGICELNSKLKDGELCVFFRNNHFSTLFKHQGELFLLLTDQGFLTQENMVWQTLSSIDGDGAFVDCNFKRLLMDNQPVPNTYSQEDQDHMLALSIQEEQQREAQQSPQQQQQNQHQGRQEEQQQQQTDPAIVQAPQPVSQEPQENQSDNGGMTEQELFDLQYALQLQEEEEARARTEQQRQQQQQQQPQRRTGRRQTPPPSDPSAHRNPQQRQSGSPYVSIIDSRRTATGGATISPTTAAKSTSRTTRRATTATDRSSNCPSPTACFSRTAGEPK